MKYLKIFEEYNKKSRKSLKKQECGRQLTVPASIETGFGPECVKMLDKQMSREYKLNQILK